MTCPNCDGRATVTNGQCAACGAVVRAGTSHDALTSFGDVVAPTGAGLPPRPFPGTGSGFDDATGSGTSEEAPTSIGGPATAHMVITMPFIEGDELAAIIRRKEKIPITRLLRITRGGAHQPDAGCPTVSESGGSCDSRARRVRREARREAASGDSIVFVLVRRSRGWRRRHTSFTSAAFRRTGRRTWAVFETSSLQSGAVCAFV
jgi:hypothetical protein